MTLSRLKSTPRWVFSALRSTVVVIMAAIIVVGCGDFDDSFGLDMTPSSQDLTLRSLDNNTGFTTSLYVSDSVRSSNVGVGVIGIEKLVSFGERRAGFFTQFLPSTEFDEDDNKFGTDPIFDSMMIYLSVAEYSGDTTVSQKFEVYEVLNADFLNNTVDSVYFNNFDMSIMTLTSEPIFTFTFPDYDNEVYTNTTSIRLYPTSDPLSAEAQSFVDRLMLEDDEADIDIYDDDERELFLAKFRGIYIKPVTEVTTEPTDPLEGTGAVYSFYLDASGIGLYARKRYDLNPEIIDDTVSLGYNFRNISYTTDAYYGMSINTVEYDTSLELDLPTSTMRVQGMGGIATKITITQEIFEQIEEMLASATDNNNEISYTSIFVNQARLSMYLLEETTANYDNSQINPLTITPWYTAMPERLGLYSSYVDYYETEEDFEDDVSMLEGIADYYYEYELVYSIILPYSGYINRSFGCYEMIISAQFQEAWNSYLEAKEDAGGDPSAINWDDIEECSFILAHVADELYSVKYASLQGMNDGLNSAPIRLRLTYTLIK